MRRFYAPPENFNGQSVQLSLDETRHLRDVLRLHKGDEVRVFDGEGREFRCTIEMIGKQAADLALIDEVAPSSPESPLELTLAAGLLKGEKLDLVIQKSVELGVSRLQPLFTKRCDVKANIKDSKTDRWRKIALEASKQTGRAKLMTIETPIEFTNFLEGFDVSNSGESRILFSERDGKSFSEVKENKKITAIVGPEGGWEDSELEAARNRGFTLVTLGGRVLRAETAAISIAAILQHRFGDFS